METAQIGTCKNVQKSQNNWEDSMSKTNAVLREMKLSLRNE